VNGEWLKSYVLAPEDFNLKRCAKSELVGGTPEENAVIARAILSGEKGAQRDAVVLNSAAAIHIAKPEITLAAASQIAAATIDSGAAQRQLTALIQLSNA
jgi:anthranilate phosphoribosyltransferase